MRRRGRRARASRDLAGHETAQNRRSESGATGCDPGQAPHLAQRGRSALGVISGGHRLLL